MNRSILIRNTAIAAALCAAAVQAARATTSVVISGSTLFEPFFQQAGSNNDYVDVDGDGFSGYNPSGSISDPANPFVQTFAPSISTGSINTSTGNITYLNNLNDSGQRETPALSVEYRGTGSVGGLMELLSSQSGSIQYQTISTGRINGLQVIANGVSTGSWPTSPGGFPAGQPTAAVDAAVLDVSAVWGTTGSAGTAAWNKKPTQPGYGLNAAPSNTGYTNQLASLTVNNTTFNLNTPAPNAQTLYNTPVAAVPINFIANPGVGISQIKATQLQQLYTTGRMPNGENLTATTRAIVSGTRNGAMNSIGVDPSYGSGDNVGADATGGTFGQLGSSYQPSNADGSGDLENIVSNSRLSIAYDGSDRAFSKNGGKWGSLQVMFDNEGGTQYVTPTVSSMLNNANVNTGWRVFGTETFVTVGDPNATPVGTLAGDGNPAMANPDAAKYIRNITASLDNYVTAPNSNSNDFMPSQVIVSNFIPVQALAYSQSATDGTSFSANPLFDASVQSDALNKGNYNGPLVNDPSIGAGFVPQRIPGAYSDGSTTGAYIDPGTGTARITSSMQLNDRNRVAGDFDGSGTRDLAQIPQMMAAFANPRAWSAATFGSGSTGTTGMAKDYAIPEIIGDFNGDGNFTTADIRYYADGLAVDPSSGNVNRKAGFTAVDNNWTTTTAGHPAGNFFSTTLGTGKPYVAGDSRGDIAGSAQGPTPGAGPTGADGIINVADVDYEIAQIKKATGQTSIKATSTGGINDDVNGAYSTLLTRATANPLIDVRADFSADMTGDGQINKDDLTDLIQNVLQTNYGDANLDGVVDIKDLQIIANHWQQSVTSWAQGDFDGNGIVDIVDLQDVANHWQAGVSGGSGSGSLDLAILAGFSGTTSSVPEPMSLSLLGLGGILLAARRRK